jgi:hypothetical protein
MWQQDPNAEARTCVSTRYIWVWASAPELCLDDPIAFLTDTFGYRSYIMGEVNNVYVSSDSRMLPAGFELNYG